MDKSQAIKAVSAELQKKDSDLYVFQPKGQPKRFLGAAVITAAATVLINAFLKGVGSAVEKRLEHWGEQVGTWMSDQLEALFRPKTQQPSANEFDQAVAAAKAAIASMTADQRAKAASEVEEAIKIALSKRGVDEDRAGAIAASAKQSALGLATGG